MDPRDLATQQDLAFIALEAQEHVECLQQIKEYGEQAALRWAAGCSTSEIRSSLEVN